ncbi:hypothetical protein UFOVP33_4 [uncultured Caudovirales phage]|uniref:Uncharacterized protein n=1 Tax=uncultured Caudovirales phage TaxID=2100421 RepID=A0A6J5KJT9_9CAUD|nr:hypothetical protein UFOVP33_4 [uncultured Caudovirales phage]
MTATYGFLALNASGQVLVSSETRNLHFVGKATFYDTVFTSDGYGGMRRWTYRINCLVTPVPFFTMPTEDYYGVSRVSEVSTHVWEIEIIRSGTSTGHPEVYVFADPRASTERDTNYGMLVMRDDGTPSFDSRLGPLAITGGISVGPPSNPLVTSPTGLDPKNCNSDPSANFGSDNSNSYSFTASGSKPIFFYPSLPQAEREVTFSASEDECDGVDAYGNCVGAARHYEWYSYYWAFYRAGIRYVGGYLFCGWITVEHGCHWTYSKDSAFIGIGTGGESGTAGTWPYSNETLNLTSTAVITANGAHYD